jgi:hypothetical protein
VQEGNNEGWHGRFPGTEIGKGGRLPGTETPRSILAASSDIQVLSDFCVDCDHYLLAASFSFDSCLRLHVQAEMDEAMF